MHRETKATAISKRVKDVVWERDGGCCVLCGSVNAFPNAHVIRRSRGGMGVEENIITACYDCHEDYDHSPQNDSGETYRRLKEYLQSHYPEWNEERLIYRKYE